MLFISYPTISKIIFPKIKKSFPTLKGKLFFTFDDGPDPSVTPIVLDILKKFNAKATFFCTGQNIEKYPEVFELIKASGHTIGNHGYKHLNGWHCSFQEFKENTEKGYELTQSKLFRPPYGKLTPKQYFWLKNKYSIIAWNIMSYDFDSYVDENTCINLVAKNLKNGSIIVFHDNAKAKEKLLRILPIILENILKKGYTGIAL